MVFKYMKISRIYSQFSMGRARNGRPEVAKAVGGKYGLEVMKLMAFKDGAGFNSRNLLKETKKNKTKPSSVQYCPDVLWLS